MKNTISIFPNGIDSRVFFSDLGIDDLNTIHQYHSLLSQGKYSQASQLLNNSEVFFYGAWSLNLLENRLNKIGSYLLAKEKRNISAVCQDAEPTENLKEGFVWIGSI